MQTVTPASTLAGRSRSVRWIPLLAFVLALLVQPLMAALLHVPSIAEQLTMGDAPEYHAIAQSLASGQGFSYDHQHPTTSRPPLYPAFLAFFYAWGAQAWVIPVQRVLGALVAALCALLGHRLGGGRAGALAGAAVGLYLPVQILPSYLASETLFIVLTLGGSLALIRALERPEAWRGFLLPGGLWGLATLTRPTLLLLPLALVALRFCRPRLPWRAFGALLLAFYLCLAPWALRNLEVSGRLMPVASMGGYNLWQGTFRSTMLDGLKETLRHDAAFRSELVRLAGKDDYLDYQAEPRFTRAALDRLKADPLGFLGLCAERTVRCWSAFPGTRGWAGSRPGLYAALSVAHVGLLVLGLLGLRRIAPLPRWALGTMLAYTFVMHAPLNLEARYLIPYLPLFLILGAVWLVGRGEAGRRGGDLRA